MPRANGKLKWFRIRAALSQEKLARRAGLDRATISKAENGRNVDIQTISKITSALSDALGAKVMVLDVLTVDQTEDINKDAIELPDFARDRIRTRMSELSISIEQLAERANLSSQITAGILNGTLRTPGAIPMRIASALDFEWNDLMTPKEAAKPRRRGWWSLVSNEEDDRRRKLSKIAKSIPDQNPLIRFEVSTNNKLKLVPSLNDENDVDTISALRGELLASDGPIKKLNERYSAISNLPQSRLFKPLVEGYDKELSKDPKDINFAVLYARGARFYAARRTAAQQVSSGEWPELDAEEASAVDAICDLHGPLIMASSVGRRMVSDAHEYETTPDIYRREQEIIEQLGQIITAETDVFDAETIEDIQALTPPIENDPQPARTRRTGILVAGSVLTVVVGGAAWLAGGSTALYIAVPAAAGFWAQKYAWEVLKKTDTFKDSSDADAERTDALIKKAEEKIGSQQKLLMEKMSQLVERQLPLFQKLTNLRPEFGWAKKHLRKLEKTKKYPTFSIGAAVSTAVTAVSEEAQKTGTAFILSAPETVVKVRGQFGQVMEALGIILLSLTRHERSIATIHISITVRAHEAGMHWPAVQVEIRDSGYEMGSLDVPFPVDTGLRNQSASGSGMEISILEAKRILHENFADLELILDEGLTVLLTFSPQGIN